MATTDSSHDMTWNQWNLSFQVVYGVRISDFFCETICRRTSPSSLYLSVVVKPLCHHGSPSLLCLDVDGCQGEGWEVTEEV
jgi:hypothetical protein